MLCTHFLEIEKQVFKFIKQSKIQFCIYNHLCETPNLCLSCPYSICSLYSKNNCALKHFQQTKHPLIISYNSGMIICNLCNDDLQSIIDLYQGQIEDENLIRLNRFTQEIKRIWMQKKFASQKVKQSKNNIFGLVNLGNTCFLNSVIQSINFTQIFKNIYEKIDFNQTKIKYRSLPQEIQSFYDQVLLQKKFYQRKTQNRQKKQSPKDYKLNKLFQKMLLDTNHTSIYKPGQIFQTLYKAQPKFKLLYQNDAHQLLRIFLDILSEGQYIFLDIDLQRYRQVQKVLGRQKINIVTNIFGTYLASRINCLKCQNISWNLDLCLDLSIELKTKSNIQFDIKIKQDGKIQQNQLKYFKQLKYPEKSTQLPKMLKNFFSFETLTKQNYFTCQKCNMSNALKKLYLIDPGPIITIVLKRFNHNFTKNTQYVQIQNIIKLDSVVLESGQWNYELYSVITHIGNMNQGHYISYNKFMGKWIQFSDQKIQEVTFEKIRGQDSYILFYKKI